MKRWLSLYWILVSVPLSHTALAIDETQALNALEQFAPLIHQCIQKRDTTHPLFHGCVDWHSAVHGHWALIRLGRTDKRFESLGQEAVRRLSQNSLLEEWAALNRQPDFEMPYGRAWFLQLAVEFDDWLRNHPNHSNEVEVQLQRMAKDVAESLLLYFDQHPPNPAHREYNNDCWAVFHLWQYSNLSASSLLIERSQRLVDQLSRHQSTITFALDFSVADFFSLFGNWAYLIARSQSTPIFQVFLENHPLVDRVLLPVEPLGPAHHLGMNWSRAWALRALSSRVAPIQATRLNLAFDAHFRRGMKSFQKEKNDYYRYGHWVAQFAVYALTEGWSEYPFVASN